MAIRKFGVAAAGMVIAVVTAVVVVAVTRGADGVAVTLNEEDEGALVELSVGEQVVVRLRGNATTGFAWEVADLDAAVVAQRGEYDYEADSGAEGSAGTFTFRFEAVGAGEATVRLVYRGPGDPAPSAGAFSFTARVG